MAMANTFERPAPVKDLRIVLVGKTGVGKSAAGNTILGKKAFDSIFSFASVTSVCKKETNVFGSLNLAVIDTPGLFDTDRSKEEVVTEIAKAICMAAPGPHVFLIVLQLSRFTEEEEKTVEIIKKLFGEKAARFTMILFTHGDELKKGNIKIKDMLEKSQPLKHIISQCSGLEKFEDKYHVFDNEVNDLSQVNGLLKKIQRMVQQNGGSFYITEMFKVAERAIQEKVKLLRRENPNMKPQDARMKAEVDNKFILLFLAYVGVKLIGPAIGAILFSWGGPAGALFGATMGGTIQSCFTQ